MTSDEIIERIAVAIANDPKVSNVAWEKLAVVAHISDTHRKYNGFAYTNGEPFVPCTPKGASIDDICVELRNTMFAEGRAPLKWNACLIQIDAESGEMNVEFEYGDATKWLVTPATQKAVAERIRPA